MTVPGTDHDASGPAHASRALCWAAPALAVVAAAATAFLGWRVGRLESEKAALQRQADGDPAAPAALEELSRRVAAAEAACRRLEDRIPDADRMHDLAAQAAREELTSARAAGLVMGRLPADELIYAGLGGLGALADFGGREEYRMLAGADPLELLDAREILEKKLEEIAAIQARAGRGELKPDEARAAVAAKIDEGLKAALPPEQFERMNQVGVEAEKGLSPEQRKLAERARAAFLDGIGEIAVIQQQVRDGKLTQDEAHRLIGARAQRRTEEFRRDLPEAQRATLDERVKAWQQQRGDRPRIMEPLPARPDAF